MGKFVDKAEQIIAKFDALKHLWIEKIEGDLLNYKQVSVINEDDWQKEEKQKTELMKEDLNIHK